MNKQHFWTSFVNNRPMIDNTEAQFLDEAKSNYSTHLPMLLLALQQTNGDVVELGSGEYSTPLLRRYCQENNRGFYTYDNNEEWASKTSSVWIKDWAVHTEWKRKCGVMFIDLAPGDYRWKAMIEAKDLADIVVVHDSEEVGLGDYQLRRAFPHFNYRLNHNRLGPGAGTSAVSNKINLHVLEGDFYGYKMEVKI